MCFVGVCIYCVWGGFGVVFCQVCVCCCVLWVFICVLFEWWVCFGLWLMLDCSLCFVLGECFNFNVVCLVVWGVFCWQLWFFEVWLCFCGYILFVWVLVFMWDLCLDVFFFNCQNLGKGILIKIFLRIDKGEKFFLLVCIYLINVFFERSLCVDSDRVSQI